MASSFGGLGGEAGRGLVTGKDEDRVERIVVEDGGVIFVSRSTGFSSEAGAELRVGIRRAYEFDGPIVEERGNQSPDMVVVEAKNAESHGVSLARILRWITLSF